MKRVGIKDVAARAGVSISTVSNALNRPETVSDALAARVRTAVDELAYVPLQAAQQLRAGRSGLLGMTVINIANPFFAAMVAGAESAAADGGVRILVGNSGDDAARERDHLELFERVQVDGVLISPYGTMNGALENLRRRGIPVVLVDAVDDAGELDSVSFDDVAGGRLAAQHLIDIGRRRLAFLGARDHVRQMRERLEGATAAVADHPAVTMEVTWTARTTAEIGRDLGARIAAMPPAERPDGIIATNDHLGCGIVHGLVRGGVRVPEEIAVVGYDDIEFAEVAAVPLTSVRQPAREMGRAAGEMLLELTSGRATPSGRTLVFDPELVVRASTLPGA
ncbi:LacI family transcriptional regulator [Microbacterium sp. W1N]|uniref:LacI family DNA-binding transcriptional regulator n=1 Tax=Microbacterium festucae TaxID=2977531 RepID=UPI0021BF8707|nr:LacI family DNA-binding transcriptional regulator [Microbacterium festucae]MCT9819789.1 LacI family transcriptional regulator [Microbacterium festucae]